MADTPETDKPKCFNCEEPCTKDDFCHGCKVHVCNDCSVNYDMPFGSHEPELHLIDEGDEQFAEEEDEDVA